jgi:geranylgeranyl reductase family protein
MQALTKHDVVIVGAGPAGATLGYFLAKNGVKALIIEKKALPRYKTCAGGLTRRTLSLLPFDIHEVVEDYSYTSKMMFRNKPLCIKTMDQPIIGMVMRDKFDYFLVEKAVHEGAVVQDGTVFQSVFGRAGDLTVETSKGKCKTRIIVGADGANSAVARELRLRIQRETMTAIEGELYLQGSDILNEFKGTVHFDFGVIPEGYGWVFPKSDHLSVGVATGSKKIGKLKDFFYSYLAVKELNSYNEINPLRCHPIPFRPNKKNVLADSRGLVVGDAAGFTDPLTGEGILYAVWGAQIASTVILNCLNSGYEHIHEYTDLLKREFLNDLVCANRMSYLIYKFPKMSERILRSHGEYLGRNQLEVISGEQTYGDLYKKILDEMFNLPKFLSVFLSRCLP